MLVPCRVIWTQLSLFSRFQGEVSRIEMAWADPRVHNDFKVRCTGMIERGDVASGEVRRRHLVI